MRILSLLIFCASFIFSNQKTNSPHGSDFKISCKTCHSSKGWQLDKEIYSFKHNKTKLPLDGQHTSLDCSQCHKTLVFKEAKSECFACHNDVHQTTVGLECSRCHTPKSWLVNNISDIHQRSRFPLVGAHRNADCIQCHKSESMARFDVPGINCIDCHRESYMATTNPNHIQAGYPQDCLFCHTLTSFQWAGSGFNHSVFPLDQGHSTAKCTDCHTTGNYTDARTDCYSCHQANYTATTNPNHIISGIPNSCANCHTAIPGWKPASYNHTTFPLTLGHSTATCNDCHKGNYTTLTSDCYSCHQANYTSTTNPNHISVGFLTACATCHTTIPGWKPAAYPHIAFPLTQGHAIPTCNDCHKGSYTAISTDCYSCHQQNYTSSTNPNHITAGMPTSCTTCHTTIPGWKPATFSHGTFPLTSGHAIPTCNDCHKGSYTAISTDCYSCHVADYNNSTNPGHVALAFATTCTQCHTTIPGWKPATYTQHDAQMFPIYSGRHKGQWTLCTDCHTNAANYILFDCKHCHTGVHKNNNYTNAQCYSCHPRGTRG